MQIPCPKCQSLNRAEAKFCLRCGQSLLVSQPSAPPSVTPQPPAQSWTTAPQQMPPQAPPQAPQPQPSAWASPMTNQPQPQTPQWPNAAATAAPQAQGWQPVSAPPQSWTPPTYGPAASQPAYVPPARQAVADTGKGHRLIGPAGAAAILLFFLPWVSVSCQGRTAASFSGWNLAAGGELATTFGYVPLDSSPVLFLVLLAAMVCVAVALLVYVRRLPERIEAMVALAAVGLSVVVLVLKMASAQSDMAGMNSRLMRVDPQLGLLGTLAAYGVIVAGAILDLRHKP